MQGIICFESVMAQAKREGVLTEEMPICCKPNDQVRAGRAYWASYCRRCNLGAVQAFEIALRQAKAEAKSTIFVDDSSRNVSGARKLGIFTVQVSRLQPEVEHETQPEAQKLSVRRLAARVLTPRHT